jgi:hypothetical protein
MSNWGLCALKLERDGEAIWAYTEYLRQSGKDADPEERKELERDLLLLNGNAASVTLTSDVPDLEVIDTRAGSAVPPQTYRLDAGRLALRLRAGSHTLKATSQGKSLMWEVTLSPGRTEEHRFVFAPASAPPAAAPAAAPAPAVVEPVPVAEPASVSAPAADAAPSRGGTVRKLGYLVTGAGVLALGGGVFFGAQAKSDEGELRDECRTLRGYGFSCLEDTEDDFEAAQSKASTANVLLIAGGVVSAGGLAMIIWGGPKKSTTTATGVQVTPVLGPAEAGIFAHGRF